MRLLAAFAAALAALVPLACSGGDDGGNDAGPAPATTTAPAPVVLAAAKTREAGSARFALTTRIEGGPAAGTITGEGTFAGRRGRMTLDLSDLGAGGAFLQGRLEVVFDGLVFYLRFPPAVAAVLPGNKPWLRVDLAQLGRQEGFDFEQLLQVNQGDPSQTLEYLRGASDDFREVGAETVRGVATTHYRGTVDLEKVAAQAPAGAAETYRRAIEASGRSTLPMDVWIDGEGLLRRMRFEQPIPGEEGASATTTIELYDFGTEVDAEPPPAGDVLDIQDLIGGTP
jgi:hypothetical protein